MKKQYFTLTVCALLFCGASALAQVGISMQNPVFAGNFSTTFTCPNTKNTTTFSNNYPTTDKPQTNDIWYKFTLLNTMEITISHCGSALSNTCLFLLNASGDKIAYNNGVSTSISGCSSSQHAYLKMILSPATYYVVSEGYSQNGEIKTTISGVASEFGYTAFPDTQSSSTKAVGSVAGVFDVSTTGAATYSIPIEVPPGLNGMQPNIAITYNSQAGNGVVGYGANISGISTITRVPKSIYYDGTAKGIMHDNSDVLALDGQRLIPVVTNASIANGTVYNTESDPFTTITCKVINSETYFEVLTKDGMKYKYGATTQSRQEYNNNGTKINAWYLSNVEDPFGNNMYYKYSKDQSTLYLDTIAYGRNNTSTLADNKIVFNYDDTRSDKILYKLENCAGSVSKRLIKITTKTGNNTFREYTLSYISDKFSRLFTVTEKNGASEALLYPISLNWHSLPTTFSQTTQILEQSGPYIYDNPDGPAYGTHYISADLNGDGLSELILTYPTNGNSLNVRWASLDASGEVKFLTESCYAAESNFVVDKSNWWGYGALDYDGDGINELFVPSFSRTNNQSNIKFTFIKCAQTECTQPTNDAISIGFALETECTKIIDNPPFYSHCTEIPLYTICDLKNNGKGSIVYVEREHGNNFYAAGVIEYNETSSSFERRLFYLNLSKRPKKLFAADFNGNGMTDLLIFHETGYTIFWNNGNGSFSDSKKTTGNLADCHMIRLGDFNGDGLPDFIMNAVGNNYLNLALNKGDGTFEIQTGYNFTNATTNNDIFNCLVYDFDDDGKSDVVITRDVPGTTPQLCYHYWLRSSGTSLQQVTQPFSKPSNHTDPYLLSLSWCVIGDFNGDGRQQLMNYGYNLYNGEQPERWRIYQYSDITKNSGKLKSVSDGLNTTDITYGNLTKNSLYTKDNSGVYPLVNIKSALSVVDTVTVSNGAASPIKTIYTYEGAKKHLQGKGFMGFKKITANNTTMGIKTETGVTSLNTTYYVPSTHTKTTTAGNKTAETTVNYTYFNKVNKKYCFQQKTNIEKDIDNNTVTTVTTVSDYEATNGNITQEKTTFGNNDNYRTTIYDYTSSAVTYKPSTITIKQKYTNENEFVNKTYFTYNAKGYPIKKEENYGTSFVLTTNYGYDAYGNMTSYKISGNDITTNAYYNSYDNTQRFVAGTTTIPATSVMAYTYDTWGNVLTEKDQTNSANILTTSHKYNNWGQKTETKLPTGQKMTITYGWGSNDNQKYFTLTQGTGMPWVKTWYDVHGRVTKTESIGAKDLAISSTNTYNAKGQLTKTVNEQGNNSLTLTDQYTYYPDGRLSEETKSSGQVIEYDYASRKITAKITTTTNNSRTYTKIFDEWGNVKTATDPGGTVSYTYYSHGNPNTITAAGATISMGYNAIGQQTSLTDPNAGTTTYEYNLLGQLKKQTDEKGNIIINTYDKFNRLDYSTLNGVMTDYTYGTTSTNNDYLRLNEITKDNMSIKYTYDSYGDLFSEERLMDNRRISYIQYQRDQLTKKTSPYFYYPDNVAINGGGNFYNKSIYDAYGNLVKKEATIYSHSFAITNATIWELTANTGTQTTAKIANASMTHTKGYNNKGFLSTQTTKKGSTNILSMGYTFEPTTGNLLERTGMNGTETFGYDKLDRLKDISSITDYVTYLPNGNINTKHNLGQYTYESFKPHAIKGVENTNNLVSNKTQIITYNAFNKVSKITEIGQYDGVNYELDITYGPDQQRWQSVLKKNGVLEKTIIFAPGYERVTTYTNGSVGTGISKHFYYIYGGDGLAAIGMNEGIQPFGKFYYAHTDHLGSIVKLTDENGTTAFEANYDAWGKQTVTNIALDFHHFHRGYTGHEHLSEFGLINMNGRMYDPLLGRMLSPDPIVHDPYFSQSFNRYSYCANNPLRYIDPSGLDQVLNTNDPDEIAKYWSSLLSGTNDDYDYSLWNFSRTPDRYKLDFDNSKNAYVFRVYNEETGKYEECSFGETLREVTVYGPSPFTKEDYSKYDYHRDKYETTGTKVINVVQTGLDVAGLVPGFGEIADGVNALIYLARGDYLNAGLSGAAMIPFLGWGSTGAKLGIKGVNAAKTGTKMLNQFNSAESLIQGAGKLDRLSGGVRQGFVKGDADAIFKSITNGGTALPSGAMKMADGTFIKLENASSGFRTIYINTPSQYYKIRITP